MHPEKSYILSTFHVFIKLTKYLMYLYFVSINIIIKKIL